MLTVKYLLFAPKGQRNIAWGFNPRNWNKSKTSPGGATLCPFDNEELIPLLEADEIGSGLNIFCNIYIAPTGLLIFIPLDPGVKTPGYQRPSGADYR